jgi:hypothetical protein
MKPFTRFISVFVLLSVLGCRSVPPSTVSTLSTEEHLEGLVLTAVALPFYAAGVRAPQGPPILEKGSDTEIRKAAVVVARADIAAGHPRICYAGTRGVSPVGVSEKHLGRVESFKRVPLPCDCSDPLASKAIVYAKAYNGEVVSYLSELD